MNRKVLIIAVVLVAVIVAGAIYMAATNDGAGNMKNPDVQNVETQDIDNSTDSPDPVKESGTTNSDTNQNATGEGNNLTSPNNQ